MSDYTIETRRRSRSKTPFLRSSCDHENCELVGGNEPHVHHHKKKPSSLTPNVKTIVEETVEVTSSSSVGGLNKESPSKMAQTKIKTSDYSSEDSPENRTKTSTRTSATLAQSQQQQQQTVTETRTSTTVITKSKKGGGVSVATSTPKASNFVSSYASQFTSRAGGSGSAKTSTNTSSSETQYEKGRFKEHTQNVLNTEKEMSTSKNKSLCGFLGNSFGDRSISLDASDHIAYMEYKKAGEYWKTTPKTDYTYSELSPHRRELAPGIVAMPNMSRQSLDNHGERINFMIQRDPAQEEYIRRRYEASKYIQNRRATEKLMYDSGDEVDLSQYQSYRKTNNLYNGRYNAGQEESWLMRIITTIVTTVTSTWSSITGSNNANTGGVGLYTYSNNMYQTKLVDEERGFFGSLVHGISSAFLAIVRNLYLFISSVLCLDTWLLQSSNAENKSRKRFLLFVLLLLPLLLLAGIYYYLHPTEPFPPKSFSEYTFTLPELPKIDITEYINQAKYDELKSNAINRYDDLRDWSNDYFLYLKTVSQNLVDEGRKVFQRKEYYEPV